MTAQQHWEQLTLFDIEDPVRADPPPWSGLPEDWDPSETAHQIADLLRGPITPTQRLILVYGLMLTDLVYRKNVRYGNSAINPISVFASGLTPQQRMAVRMDDKVNRIVYGTDFGDDGENPMVDLAGYLLLSLVAERQP